MVSPGATEEEEEEEEGEQEESGVGEGDNALRARRHKGGGRAKATGGGAEPRNASGPLSAARVFGSSATATSRSLPLRFHFLEIWSKFDKVVYEMIGTTGRTNETVSHRFPGFRKNQKN